MKQLITRLLLMIVLLFVAAFVLKVTGITRAQADFIIGFWLGAAWVASAEWGKGKVLL